VKREAEVVTLRR